MKKHFVIPIIFLFNFTYSQQVDLINENFDSGVPANWTHCSTNWFSFPQWAVDSGALKEASGPYFGNVLNAIQLTAVDLTLISDPFLEFDLAMAVIDTNIRFSVWYTTDTTCNRVLDTITGSFSLDGWNLLSSYSPTTVATNNNWTPLNTDYQTISIDLMPFKNDSDIRFSLVSEYMNAWAYGVWYLDNVKIFGSSFTGVFEHSQSFSFQLFPNPFTTSTTIRSDHPISSYRIYSISGRLVREAENSSGNTITIDRGNMPSGMYFIEVLSEDSTIARQKVIIQ